MREPEPAQPDSTGPAQQREAEPGVTKRDPRERPDSGTYLAQPPAQGRSRPHPAAHPGPRRRLPQSAKGAGQLVTQPVQVAMAGTPSYLDRDYPALSMPCWRKRFRRRSSSAFTWLSWAARERRVSAVAVHSSSLMPL
jgi:hypothetical protein